MKTKIALIVIIALLAGCSGKVKKENEELKLQTEKLKKENTAFRNQNKKLSASLDEYKSTLNEIDENLKSIDVSATMVGKMSIEERRNSTQRERVLARLAAVKSLLDNSKLKVLALDKSLIELRKKFGDQSEVVLELNRELKAQTRLILEKEKEYLLLTSSMEEDMDELQRTLDEQMALTNQLNELINRAFTFSGNSKELKDKGIVSKEGGFIGLGRVKVLNANSDNTLFKQIKKDETKSMTFASKGIKIITEHPIDSYKVKSAGNQTELVILDNSFWKAGNYLVIELK